MKYIKRTLEQNIIYLSKEYACILLIGPRQIGKTTILEHIDKDKKREYVTLDDLSERELAKNDPKMFLNLHNVPMCIDEVQYAPELFSYIRIAIDNGTEPGSFFLTGSQSFKFMQLAKETLAGRVAIINMSSLSQSEIYHLNNSKLELNLNSLKKRNGKIADIKQIYNKIFDVSLPALVSKKYTNKKSTITHILQHLLKEI